MHESGSLPHPRVSGRIVRLVLGAVVLFYAWNGSLAFTPGARMHPSNLALVAVVTGFLLREVGRTLLGTGKRAITWGYAAILIGAIATSLVLEAEALGRPVTVTLAALFVPSMAFLGLSFLLQALFATPG